jgi:hypothetical protein
MQMKTNPNWINLTLQIKIKILFLLLLNNKQLVKCFINTTLLHLLGYLHWSALRVNISIYLHLHLIES